MNRGRCLYGLWTHCGTMFLLGRPRFSDVGRQSVSCEENLQQVSDPRGNRKKAASAAEMLFIFSFFFNANYSSGPVQIQTCVIRIQLQLAHFSPHTQMLYLLLHPDGKIKKEIQHIQPSILKPWGETLS